jgi:uncharacterized protein (TIGR02266 family)
MSSERRTAPVLKVRCKSETVDDFVTRYAPDFAHDGVFVKARSPLPIATLLRFEFQLKDGAPVFGGRGRVTWVRDADESPSRPAGMGIAFGDIGDDARAVIGRLVGARGGRLSRYEHRGPTMAPPAAIGAETAPGASDPVGPGSLALDSEQGIPPQSTLLDPALLDLELGAPSAPKPAPREPAPRGLLGSALALSGDDEMPAISPTPPEVVPLDTALTPLQRALAQAETNLQSSAGSPPDPGPAIPSKLPSGLFSALISKPFEIEVRRSTPLPIAVRLKASSAPPPGTPRSAGPPPRVAPPPPRLPAWKLEDEDEATLEFSEEAYEPHPAPASLAPPKRGPLSAQVRQEGTIGQLAQLLEEAFHETAKRSTRPAAPDEALDLVSVAGGTPLQVEEQDIEELSGAELAGEIQREDRRSGADVEKVRAAHMDTLVKSAAREEWAGAPPMTWILFVLFLCAAGSAWFSWKLGPMSLASWMEPLVEFLRPMLEDLGWW